MTKEQLEQFIDSIFENQYIYYWYNETSCAGFVKVETDFNKVVFN